MDPERNRHDESSVGESTEETGSLKSNLVYLGLLAALLTYLVVVFDLSLTAILMVALGLTVVVFVHELGHFAVAKWCDVHVEVFSIGFGPALPGCWLRHGETTYMIGALPLGGYVKMVGEGPDSEDTEEDPRSFKNKSVWQRMAIISAGVTMNLLLAVACFVFVYRTHGAERSPGVVELLDPGSPAWKLGVRSGDLIHWIGNRGPDPYFDELRPVVMNSRVNEKLNFVWGPPGAGQPDMHRAGIEPKKTAEDTRPVIGIAPPHELKLVSSDSRKERQLPAFYSNAAAQAKPPLEFDDEIIGMTDPKDHDRVTDLPVDPRHPGFPDYFVFLDRMKELAGQKVVLKIARQNQGHKEIVTVTVPAAYHWVFGMRMRMGAIAAVRDESPAAKAGILPGDVIDGVQVKNAHGEIVQFGNSGPAGGKKPVKKQDLDPMRLPWQLAEVIGTSASPTVTLFVVRTNPSSGETHSERQVLPLETHWDPSWRFNQEMPIVAPTSPLSIPELGLAYHVETRIEGVAPGSPASRALVIDPVTIKFQKGDDIQRDGKPLSAADGESIDLKPGDRISLRPTNVVKAIRFMKPREQSGDKIVSEKKWQTIENSQWAYFFSVLQLGSDSKDIDLQVDRDGQLVKVHLVAEEDKSWPQVDRGLPLIYDTRLQKAESLGQALGMGLGDTWDFITQIYQNLEGLMTGRVSPNIFGGPFMIAHIAYKIAGHDYYRLITFLGIISVNLAVINFLPIPVLDGGHMMFLVYEKLRGRPAPKRLQEAATYIGLALILCLLVAVVFLDFFNFKRM